MSEQQEMITPVPADKPTTRRYSLLRGVAVKFSDFVGYGDGRGAVSDRARHGGDGYPSGNTGTTAGERLTPAALAPLQSRLSELEAKLQTESARLAQLARQPVLTEVQQTQLNELPASLEQIQAAQKALSLRLDTLAALTEKPQPQAVQSESSSASGTGKKDVSGTKEPSPVVQKTARPLTARSGTSHTFRQAPFVLTGTERRGAVICGDGTPGIYQSVAGGTARGR